MTRRTVTFTMPDDPTPRHFHLDEAKAERFAARIRAEGGTASIGDFQMGADLTAMLRSVGVDPAQVR